jgi:dienelactone hydrolase
MYTRTDVELEANGTTLRGWLYRPERAEAKAPAVVMAHGCTAVKEMFLDAYAEVFAAAGLAALVYDRRNLGASDGGQRQEVDPWADVCDYRDAVSYLRTLPGIDRDRIAIWGTSYGGGIVLAAAALDRRVRCVVAQVPVLTRRRIGDGPLRALLDADRDARYRGEPPRTLPVCTPDPRVPALLPTPDVWAFKQEVEARAPAWKNEVTLRSVENLAAWDPVAPLRELGHTPALILAADEDLLISRDELLAACEHIAGPKQIVHLSGGHFDAYNPVRPQFATASGAAREFLVRHLAARPAG